MKAILYLAMIIVFFSTACGTQDSAGGSTDSDSSIVLARIGDVVITEQMINDELIMIPPYQRPSFETPEGKRMLLNHIVERELLLIAATDLGLEEDSFVIAQVEQAMQQVETTRQRALIQTYYQQEVVDAVVIPDESILEYYNEHTVDIYFQEAQVKASHILFVEAAEASDAILAIENAQSFADAAMEFSDHEPTAVSGGELGWININAPIPYLGEQTEISQALFDAEVGTVLGPYTTTMGTHYFIVTDKKEEGVKPLEDVRESIEDILKPAIVNSYFQEDLLPSLRERYQVEIIEEAFLPDETVPADSLLQSAQNLMESDPESALTYFKLFLDRFPDHERAHQAQFLIGFTFSEQLGDYDAATEAFQTLIDNYPESDFADDAEWMIENMGIPPEELLIENQSDSEEGNTEETPQ